MKEQESLAATLPIVADLLERFENKNGCLVWTRGIRIVFTYCHWVVHKYVNKTTVSVKSKTEGVCYALKDLCRVVYNTATSVSAACKTV